MMTVEMRKRPVIKGKDAEVFLKRAEQNKKNIEKRKENAIKKWSEQQREAAK
ncbi:hypothetical protein IRY55_11290 [Savagea sp. SN6]|uniref:Uncharacterized protein n=1 Tax=Savagea serpentis TaxID=2785297 RepID=A0A8J7KLZ3_9BACL|nr:hypothetical protein [Savagea serpentis]MBF4501949.1 hypothetical protein [Savagea serpentis]